MSTKTNTSVLREIKQTKLFTGIKLDLLEILSSSRGLTAGEIHSLYTNRYQSNRSRNEIAKRLTDLKRMGVVETRGTAKCATTGKTVSRWFITGKVPNKNEIKASRYQNTGSVALSTTYDGIIAPTGILSAANGGSATNTSYVPAAYSPPVLSPGNPEPSFLRIVAIRILLLIAACIVCTYLFGCSATKEPVKEPIAAVATVTTPVFNACKFPKIFKPLNSEWNKTDDTALTTAMAHCSDHYKKSPCLSRFFKIKTGTYKAMCGEYLEAK